MILGDQIWVTTATEDGRELSALAVDKNSGKILFDLKLFQVEKPQYAHPFNTYASPTPVIEPGRVYVDRETGEPLEPVAKVLPLAPSGSALPWAVENLRFCNWCDQLAQRDLNDCPTCGRRMAAIER